MIAVTVLLRLILLIVFLVDRGICEQYKIGFNEGFSNCKDFENKVLDGDNMQLGHAEDGEDGCFLEGWIGIAEAIQEGWMFDLEIAKETEVGSEPMWSCSVDVCKSIDDEDAPWAAALQEMNIKACPVETGEYHCKNFTLDMSSMKDMLCEEFQGTYGLMMKIKNDKMDVVSCHMLGLSIEPCDDE